MNERKNRNDWTERGQMGGHCTPVHGLKGRLGDSYGTLYTNERISSHGHCGVECE